SQRRQQFVFSIENTTNRPSRRQCFLATICSCQELRRLIRVAVTEMGSTSQREDSHGAVTRTATRARVSSTITRRPTGHGELHEPNASFDARPASDNNSLESRYRFNHLPFTHAARAWGQDRGELLSQSFPEPATDFHLIINGKSSVTRSRISSRTVPI